MPITLIVLISMGYRRETGFVLIVLISQTSIFNGIFLRRRGEHELRRYREDDGVDDHRDGDSYNNNNGIARGRECEIELGINSMPM